MRAGVGHYAATGSAGVLARRTYYHPRCPHYGRQLARLRLYRAQGSFLRPEGPFVASSSLPALSEERFAPALAIHPEESKDLAALRTNGWSLIDPERVAQTPASYQCFVRGSKAEFGIAKSGYVASRCGSQRPERLLPGVGPSCYRTGDRFQQVSAGRCRVVRFRYHRRGSREHRGLER